MLAACASISLAVDVIKALQATVTVSGAVVGNILQQSQTLSQALTQVITHVII